MLFFFSSLLFQLEQVCGTMQVLMSVCDVSICPVLAPTSEGSDLETSVLFCVYIFRISRSFSYYQGYRVKDKITGAKGLSVLFGL